MLSTELVVGICIVRCFMEICPTPMSHHVLEEEDSKEGAISKEMCTLFAGFLFLLFFGWGRGGAIQPHWS